MKGKEEQKAYILLASCAIGAVVSITDSWGSADNTTTLE
jgi:hypothetical protein